jgi:hypothetical protein
VQRQEIPNNTDDQVEEYVTKALNLVRDLDPAPDLRAAVFEAAVGLYSGKQILVSEPQPVDLSGIREWNGMR